MYIQELFSTLQFPAHKKKSRKTERGDLLEYFVAKINKDRAGTKYEPITVKFLAWYHLGHLKKLEDLYYLKSVCDKEEERGENWSKVFFGQLKVKNK